MSICFSWCKECDETTNGKRVDRCPKCGSTNVDFEYEDDEFNPVELEGASDEE